MEKMSSAECGSLIVNFLCEFRVSDTHVELLRGKTKSCGELLETLHMIKRLEEAIEASSKKERILN